MLVVARRLRQRQDAAGRPVQHPGRRCVNEHDDRGVAGGLQLSDRLLEMLTVRPHVVALAAAGAAGVLSAGQQGGRAADLDGVAGNMSAHALPRGGGEAMGGPQVDAGLTGCCHDRPSDRVLAGVLRSSRERQQIIRGPPVCGRRDPGDSRGAFGKGAGLVERDLAGVGEAFHHHGGLDQHPVAAGQSHRREQRRHVASTTAHGDTTTMNVMARSSVGCRAAPAASGTANSSSASAITATE